MPAQRRYIDHVENSILTRFNAIPPMSIYQIAIAVTNFEEVNVPLTVLNRLYLTEYISLWCTERSRESLKFARYLIGNVTSHLQSEFNRITIPKMDHIVIPNFPHDGMSKWGLIFHR
jgi:aminopeptidase N